MAINLKKNEGISLKKMSTSALTKVAMGLGWECSRGYGPIDLDASCITFDAYGNRLQEVWFSNLRASDGSISHSGDNRTGAGDGDDETITVDLSRLDPRTDSLFFTVNSFTGQNFSKIDGISCNLYNLTNGKERLASYSEKFNSSNTAIVLAKINKKDGEWQVEAVGQLTNGRTIHDLESFIRKLATQPASAAPAAAVTEAAPKKSWFNSLLGN